MTIFRCFSIVVVISLLPAQHLSCCLHSPTSMNPEQFISIPISILHHTYYCLQQKLFECRVITKSTLLEVLNVSSQVSDTISKWQNTCYLHLGCHMLLWKATFIYRISISQPGHNNSRYKLKGISIVRG
jgi:hypothetical protein